MIVDGIARKVEMLREHLEGDPLGLVAGKLPPGDDSIEEKEGPIGDYYDFLRVTNGARCGAVVLWAIDELPGKQYVCSDISGGTEVWFCIGHLIYEPLVINRQTGELRLIRQVRPPDVEGVSLGALEEFLDHEVFGSGYASLVPDVEDEEWYRILIQAGLAG